MRMLKVLVTFVHIVGLLAISQRAESQRPPATLFYADSIDNINTDIRNDRYGKISSLIIYQNHRIAYESYYGFTQASTLHPISSVTKSITSLAVGICLDRGYIPSLDVKLIDYFPEYHHIFEKDSLKQAISLRHLLNQTSGLKWDEWTIHYSYAGNPLIELSQKPESWIPIILSLPMDTVPGAKFNYNSGCSDLIKEIVERSSGLDFRTFVDKNILTPLNIASYHWDTYPENGEPAWGGLSLTTRDMAKIGVLVHNHGKWGNKAIVSEQWINESVAQVIEADSIGYGYHWWVKPQPDGHPLIFAAGYGDQYVFIAPDKNLVVAINAKNFTDHKWERDHTDLINRILRAYIHNGMAQSGTNTNKQTYIYNLPKYK